jgi:hypothetical protein
MLYLHETIDIRGDGARPYMEGVLERARHSEKAGISRLVGTWQVVGSTHRWPRVVNLWELDGWEHWARSLERQFDPAKKDAHLAPWWSSMVRYRRGGFDRILEPVWFSPRRSDLESRGYKGSVVEQQLCRVPAQWQEIFFEEVSASLVPLLEANAVQLIGAYRAVMRADEVLLLWLAETFRGLCAWKQRCGGDQAYVAWLQRQNAWRVRVETLWLVPFPGSLLSPATVVA